MFQTEYPGLRDDDLNELLNTRAYWTLEEFAKAAGWPDVSLPDNFDVRRAFQQAIARSRDGKFFKFRPTPPSPTPR